MYRFTTIAYTILSIVLLFSAYIIPERARAVAAQQNIPYPELRPPFAEPPDDEFARPVPATRTLWVAPDGDDGNSGMSRAEAWKDFNVAVARMQPGDVLQVVQSPGHSYTAGINLDANDNGQPGKPKIIRGVDTNGNPAQPSQRPTIVPGSSGTRPFTFSSQYWILEGVSIDCNNEDIVGVYVIGAAYIAVRHSTIRNCQNMAIIVRNSQQVLIEGNLMQDNIHQNGEDSNGVMLENGSHHVRIRGNTANNNSGDGVQCEGVGATVRHVIIEGNVFNNNHENAVDIKRCENVDIIANVDLSGYTQPENESPPSCGGVAIVLHNSTDFISAKNILVEGNNIHDSGVGITIGRSDPGYEAVENVVVRRNRIYAINQNQRNCGDGIRIQRVRRAEIYHNTLDNIAHSGIFVRGQGDPNEHVRVWNNIITNVQGQANQSHNIRAGGHWTTS